MTTHSKTVLDRRAVFMLIAVGLLSGVGLRAQDSGVIAHDGWVRVPLPSKTETALFVVLENHSKERRAVVSASSDAAEKVEMHEMKMDRTMMVMKPVSEIGIPAKGKTALSSNGFHLMMFGLKTRPAVGDTITVTLKLDNGETVPVKAEVRK
ncbi:MAG: copper chaperone PCu(A)C [Bryobacteraceae bacterium]